MTKKKKKWLRKKKQTNKTSKAYLDFLLPIKSTTTTEGEERGNKKEKEIQKSL